MKDKNRFKFIPHTESINDDVVTLHFDCREFSLENQLKKSVENEDYETAILYRNAMVNFEKLVKFLEQNKTK